MQASIVNEPSASSEISEEAPEPQVEPLRQEKKRDRRRHHRRRRGREETLTKESEESIAEELSMEEGRAEPVEMQPEIKRTPPEGAAAPTGVFSTLLPPPPTLISETIARYKDNAMFKGAFFTKEEKLSEQQAEMDESSIFLPPAEELPVTPIAEPAVFSEPITDFELEETLPEKEAPSDLDLPLLTPEESQIQKQEEEQNHP